ncbi:MAG: rhodanese-like domain-containing protein [Gammaproteobacteria bacterium]|jgi:rhodanese-related sulfurtransferase
MSNAELNPLQACAEFERDPDATYVDVRAVAEFAVRHPKTARVVNVPIVFFHPTTKATHPNDSFAIVMNDVFAKDARLIVGADEGPRAVDAAEALRADGFTNVSVMQQGFAGWVRYDLPVTADNRPGTSYVSLLTPAKRRKQG